MSNVCPISSVELRTWHIPKKYDRSRIVALYGCEGIPLLPRSLATTWCGDLNFTHPCSKIHVPYLMSRKKISEWGKHDVLYSWKFWWEREGLTLRFDGLAEDPPNLNCYNLCDKKAWSHFWTRPIARVSTQNEKEDRVSEREAIHLWWDRGWDRPQAREWATVQRSYVAS